MNLLVDVGNTRIKWAFQYDGEEPAGATSTTYDKADFAALAHNNWGKMDVPKRVLVANVAGGGLGEQLSAWVLRRWRITAEFLTPTEEAYGVINAYDNPKQLGADRWACLLAAHAGVAGPSCVIDCGTATTIDVLEASGQHRGGLILPGIQMMRQALVLNTSQIRIGNREEREPRLDLGRSTEQAVEQGSCYSTVATIERIVTQVSEELGEDVTAVMTGGDAVRIVSLLTIACEHRPDFVLDGLAVVGRS